MDEIKRTLEVIKLDFSNARDFRNYAHGYIVGMFHSKKITHEEYIQLFRYYGIQQ